MYASYVNSLMSFDKCIQLFNHHHNQDIEQFYHKNDLVPVCSHPHSLYPPAATDLISAFFQKKSNKWNHTVFSLLRVASFTLHCAFESYLLLYVPVV